MGKWILPPRRRGPEKTFVGDDVRSLQLVSYALAKDSCSLFVRDSSPRLLHEISAARKSPLASPAMSMKLFGFTVKVLPPRHRVAEKFMESIYQAGDICHRDESLRGNSRKRQPNLRVLSDWVWFGRRAV